VERDYLHVRDLIELLVRVVDRPAANIFNAGSGNPIRIGDLFELFFRAYGIPFDLNLILQTPLRPSFTQVLSIVRAREEFGFRPSYPIQQWVADVARVATV
jgi:nucleoside-diphosphate-sugar epimerase